MKAWYVEEPIWKQINKKEAILEADWRFIVDGTDFWIPQEIYSIDGASIPIIASWIPGIGKPFDKDNIIGGGAHDPLFLAHVLGFNLSNEVAYQLWRQAKKPAWASKAMWCAIQSPAGRLAWRNGPAELECLAITRRQIKWRDDWQKFESLWFSKEAA